MANYFQTELEQPELESLASLAGNLVYRIPGCDDVVLRKTLQEVAREFVADTQCLTSRQPLMPDEGGMCYLATFFGGKVAEVREVWKFQRRLRRGVEWNWPIGSGLRIAQHLIPRPVTQGQSAAAAPTDAVRYPPLVNVIGDSEPTGHCHGPSPFSAVVVEHLPPFSERLPKWFLSLHGDAICSGVLARMYSMTGKTWSDPQQAMQERVNYENAKSELRMKREMPLDGRAIDTSEVL
ncbi:MAG: hypothetical protein J6V72_19770 [Kiritimatiellae bacterium]|nr:hypothetical protein [Kiritimatiellia bacterium]